VPAELDEAKRWEREARGMLDIQSAEIQVERDKFKFWQNMTY
jgi:hypothetical protein